MKQTPASMKPLHKDEDEDPPLNDFNYRSVVGMLMYLASNTRPDISYAVHQAARFLHCPKLSHKNGILRICRYLQKTKTKGLQFQPEGDLKLDCYVDADFAGLYGHEDSQDPTSVKSRTGYVLIFGGCPLLWCSKLQT